MMTRRAHRCGYTGFSGEQRCTPACGAVWMHSQAMSGMTCGGTLFPMRTGINAKSAKLGSLPLDLDVPEQLLQDSG